MSALPSPNLYSSDVTANCDVDTEWQAAYSRFMTALINAAKDDTLKIAGVPCELTTFSPAEAEAMTGIPQSLQRVWRKRGFMPPNAHGRHARYDSWELAQLAVRFQLTHLGKAISETFKEEFDKPFSQAAHVVMILALLCADGTCEVYGKPDKVQKFLASFDDPKFKKPDTWQYHRFFVSVDGGPFYLSSTNQRPPGTMTFAFVDLSRLGKRLVDAVGKPLFTVRLDDQGRRRLSYATKYPCQLDSW